LTAGCGLEPVTETEKVSSTFTEKTKSLKLPERLRNLGITPSDVERVVELPEKLKSRDDDHAEHSRGGGIWRGVSMQRHCEYCMHKDNKDYKNAEQRRDRVVAVEENSGVCKEAERRSRKCIVEECYIERIWRREHKMEKNRKGKGVQKTLMQKGRAV
jgi:hypothetical protein